MKSSKRKTTLIVVMGIIVILSLNFFQKEVKGFFYFISSPIQQRLQGAGDNVSDFFAGILDSTKLKKENEDLKLKLQELLTEKTSLEEFKEENHILRDTLGVGLQKEFRLALVELISKDIGQNSILINQGSEDGLSKGMPVITQEKVLLGKISEVYDRFSRVSLISSKDSSFDVEISGRDAFGVIKGNNSQFLNLDFVSQDKEIKQGDLIVSVSLGGIYPKGLLVGLVQEAIENDIEPFYRIKVSSFFNLGETDNILVILDF